MASFQSSAPSAAPPSSYSSTPMASSTTRAGTFAPGTKVQVGSHRVVIEKYLSEGGFAHVYVARVPLSGGRTASAVLKRVAVPDKDALANMRTEVETMKRLKGHKHIVTYIDSHASQLKGEGYEVFLLMEYCDGGGLIDFMNTRLKNRLTEPEILHIFSDAAEGLACMHYLKPPLLHRDLKVENILISNTGSAKIYKLCDFGSSAPPRPAASSAAEGRIIEDDVQKHTTLQYRSPEMIDVYQKRPIDEKSDIWAMGVLLYKLCYYTTPFETQGQMAILTASFKYPGYPKFSDRLKKLIASMLTQDPRQRPNIYQIISEVCAMRGTAVPIKDIYATRSQSEARNNQQLPDPEAKVKSPPHIGAQFAPPEQIKQELPNITPMRRGRPTSSTEPNASSQSSKKAPTKNNKDPFAALDSPSFTTRSKAVDDLSARFPPAEEFSLLQNKDSTFQFGGKSEKRESLNDRITHALADNAFVVPATSATTASSRAVSQPSTKKPIVPEKDRLPERPKIESFQDPSVIKPQPERPKMVSTGTMTSQPSSPKIVKSLSVKDRPIWRVPPPKPVSPRLEQTLLSGNIELPDRSSSKGGDSQLLSAVSPPRGQDSLLSPNSSKQPSEGPIQSLSVPSRTVHRSRSADEPSLSPTRTNISNTSEVSVHRRNEDTKRIGGYTDKADLPRPRGSPIIGSTLQSLQDADSEFASKLQLKRSSSAAGSKNTGGAPTRKDNLGGKLGQAFRRFEAGFSGNRSSIHDNDDNNEVNDEILGKAINSSASHTLEDSPLDETEDLSPEIRRELERRRLSQEERRVAEAGAAYRQQLANGEGRSTGVSRASAIQNRVASLLDESGRVSPVKKTAKGYGKFTDASSIAAESTDHLAARVAEGNSEDPQTGHWIEETAVQSTVTADSASLSRISKKPVAPPKPKAFRTGGAVSDASKMAQSPAMAVDEDAGDLESDFSRRYPRLSLDIIEREIQKSHVK